MKKDGFLLALCILLWGINFYFIRQALNQAHPMTVGFLRFLLLLLPAIFFFPRPRVAWRHLFAYGFFISVVQFGSMMSAMHYGLPASLTALLAQGQAFITLLLVYWLWREKPSAFQTMALLVALLGITAIALGLKLQAVPLLAFFLGLLAALGWALGNITVKQIGAVPALSLVVWGNVFTLPQFLLLAIWQQGWSSFWADIRGMNLWGWTAVAYQSYASTLVAYGIWGYLLARHPAPKIVPAAMLTPAVALLVSMLFLGERLNAWQWLGVALMALALSLQFLGRKRL